MVLLRSNFRCARFRRPKPEDRRSGDTFCIDARAGDYCTKVQYLSRDQSDEIATIRWSERGSLRPVHRASHTLLYLLKRRAAPTAEQLFVPGRNLTIHVVAICFS